MAVDELAVGSVSTIARAAMVIRDIFVGRLRWCRTEYALASITTLQAIQERNRNTVNSAKVGPERTIEFAALSSIRLGRRLSFGRSGDGLGGEAS